LHDRRGEPDDHAGLPAVEHDGRGTEDKAERDPAGVDAVERDRVTLGERRGREHAGDPRERHRVARIDGERDRGRRSDRETQQPHRQNNRREPRRHFCPHAHSAPYQPQLKSSQPQSPVASERLTIVASTAASRAFFHCNMIPSYTAKHGRQQTRF
jgi:hypothetical protein